MFRVPTTIAMMAISGQALASNFSYTYVEGAAGVLSLDNDLVYENEVYEEFGVGVIGGAYQFTDGFVLQGRSMAATNDGPDTEITMSRVVFSAAMPISSGDRIDIVPRIGFISVATESCFNDLCGTEDENGIAYGLGARAWAVPERLEIFLRWADSTLDYEAAHEESRVTVGAALWLHEAHSVRFSRSEQDEQSTTTIGYRYTW